jgi:hypothetical protein
VIRENAHHALQDLREVIGVLRAPVGELPQPTLADVRQLVAESGRAGMRVELREEVGGAVPDLVGRTAYRIVQEALTNARKHAPGAEVDVRVAGAPGRGLTVEVRNHPPGPGPAAGRPAAPTPAVHVAAPTPAGTAAPTPAGRAAAPTPAGAAAPTPTGAAAPTPTGRAAASTPTGGAPEREGSSPAERLGGVVHSPAPAVAARGDPGPGQGLAGLAERVALANGRLEHGPTTAGGFRLAAWLPWPA